MSTSLGSSPRPLSWRQDARLLRRIGGLFVPYRWKLSATALSIVVSSIPGLATAFFIKAIFDEAIPRQDLGQLAWYAAAMFAIPVAGGVIALVQVVFSTQIVQGIVTDVRNRMYQNLLRMSLRYLTENPSGAIMSRLTSDVGAIQALLTNVTTGMVGNVTIAISSLVAMFYLSTPLTLVSLTLLPVILGLSFYIGNRRRVVTGKRQSKLAQIGAFLAETLSLNGSLLVAMSGRRRSVLSRYDEHNRELGAIELQQQLAGRAALMGVYIVSAAVPAAIYLLGGWQIVKGTGFVGPTLTIGGLVAFTTVQGRFFSVTSSLLTRQTEIQAGLAVFERIFETIDLRADIEDRSTAVEIDGTRSRGELAFLDVSFSYRTEAPNSEPGPRGAAVENITFQLQPGELVALVGPSGAGKTTIANLVPRLYDVDAGSVTIDGRDIRDLKLASLRSLIGLVSQDPFLLHATIRENLEFARPGASPEEMIEAARAALIHDRIMELERGYDTMVGERGYRLSGGEKQRLAIARTLLKNPRILILDEATSALDATSEQLIQRAMSRLLKGRTTLVIAHRLSTILNADQILVIDRGRIVCRGRHAELMATSELYEALCKNHYLGHPDGVGPADER